MAKVDIVISTAVDGVKEGDVKKPANGGQSAQAPAEALQGSNTKMVAVSVYASQLARAGLDTLKTGFNFAKSMYGDFTGDYIGQAKIDNAVAGVQQLVGVGSSIVGGAMVGGVAGAVVGAVVSVGSLVTEAVTTNVRYDFNLARTNANAGFNASRLGAILINGNRG